MNNRRVLVKRIGLVGVANLLQALSAIILLPILTKNISISDYGIWVQINVTTSLIPALALFGLPLSMVRFLPSLKEKKEIRSVLYPMVFIMLSVSFALCGIIFLQSRFLASVFFNGDVMIVQGLSLIVFLECLNTITESYFRAMQQIKRYTIFKSLKISLNIVLVAYFVMFGYGIYGAILGFLITVASSFLITGTAIILDVGIAVPKFNNIRDYIAFGLPTVPANMSSWVVSYIDRYVIGLMLGTAAVGYYSPGNVLGNMMGIFMTPVSFLLPAVLSKCYDEHDIAEVKTIMNYAMKYFLVLAIPSAFGLSLLSKSILTVLSTPEIASRGYLITPFTSLSALFLGAYAVTSQIIALEKKTQITGAIWILAAILDLGLNLILVRHIGILGAAITNLLVFGFTFVITTYYANKYLEFSFDLIFIFKSISASILMSIFVIWFHPVETQKIMICVAVAALIYFFALFLLKGVTKDESSFFMEMLKQ